MTQSITLLLCVFYISYGKYHTWWQSTTLSWASLDVSPDNAQDSTTEGTPDDTTPDAADGADATDAADAGDAADAADAGGF